LFHRSWINSRSTFKGEGAPDVALVDPSPADLRAKTMARRPPVGLEELREYFHKPEKQVAVELGMCLTSLKKICRNLGVHRWPHRKIKSMDKKIKSVEAAIEGSSSVVKPSLWVETGKLGSSGDVTPTSSIASIATTPRLCCSGSTTPSDPSHILTSCEEEEVMGQGASSAMPEGYDVGAGPTGPATNLHLNLDDFIMDAFAGGGGDCDDHAVEPKSPEPEPYTDEELVAMLAGCAGVPAGHVQSYRAQVPRSVSPFQQHGAEDTQSDLQILSSLVECAGEIQSFDDEVHDSGDLGMFQDI